jgi:suppressor of G2 allele of SKP1
MEQENSIQNDLFYLAAKDYVNDNFKEAVSKFTELLNSSKDNFNALLYRASSYISLGDHAAALKDLEEAEKMNAISFEVQYKKGISHFYLENFLDSSTSFKKALQLASNQEQREKLIIWVNKVELEMQEHDITTNVEVNQAMTTSDIKIIHNWYQSPTDIFLTLNSNLPLHPNDFVIVLDKKILKITGRSNGIKVWEMHLSNSIIPEASSYEVRSSKVEFKLKKEVANFDWVTLDVDKLKDAQSAFKPSYPTSSKVKKDWDSLNSEITKELNEDAKNDPNEGMMKLFKDIYERSDEKTRRAMMKSFQTSSGTVLSTNWDEVGDKDYEGKDKPEAPKGQEWRKYEP